MFGLEDGFDVVIGNRPTCGKRKSRSLKPALQKQYTCYTGVADLYVYFIEGGYRWLRERGVLCYICSNKYFRAGYGKKLRGYLSKQATIRQLIDFGDAPVFTAIAYPSIVLFQKQTPNDNRLTAFNWEPGPPVTEFEPVFATNKFRMPQSALTADGWRLEQREVLRLLGHAASAGIPLGEYVQGRFYRGILTGLNEAFVVDRATRDRLIAEHPSSAEVLKPYLRGQDIKRWCLDYSNLYVIFTRRGTQIDNYPAIKKHLSKYKDRLMPKPSNWTSAWEGRKVGSYKWFEIQDNIAYWQEFSEPKILYQEIATYQSFAWDNVGYFSNNKTFLIPGASLYLLAILNSSTTWFFLDKLASKLQGGAYAMQTPYVSQIPVPQISDKYTIESRVERILATKQADPTANISALEREIDELVYALYNLTPAEIALIEGREPTEAEPLNPSLPTPEVRSNRFSGSTAKAVTTNMSTPPLIFTGQPPQGSFSAKRARLETLTKQATPAAIQELTAALTDENVTIRWQASTALRNIGGPQVASTLQAFINHTNNPTAKSEAEKVLGYVKS
ncbi:MAG: Eco57I restriction-modification methylase domain-containing protein [Chloroflexi bacterium]|nr:Eco57I restriction-modification methylase domain-containing protein [Chloroflexota bacterium]